MKSNPNLENLRLSYKPPAIRLLFIGESPPAKGTFFYQADSNLYRYTQNAFAETFGPAVGSGEDFLLEFGETGHNALFDRDFKE